MATSQLDVQHFSLISSRSFDDIVATLDAAIGHPEMNEFRSSIASSQTLAELERIVHNAVGHSDLMEFARFDMGQILAMGTSGSTAHILRLLVGNPLIMKQMVSHVPEAASYAPVTILIDERADGVHLSYDTMASYLAPYGSPEALAVAWNLDSKLTALLTTAAV